MDGILSNKRKKRNTRSKRRKPDTWLTVSARTREKNAERRRVIGLFILITLIVAGFGWFGYLGLAAAGRHLFTENEKYQVLHWDLQSNGPLLTSQHIREYAQLRDQENLLALNLNEIRRRLESVPVVQSVEVSRQLPDTLIVRVDERLAVARLGADTRMALAVDRTGHVLGPGSLRPNLPAVVGLREPGLRPGMTITDPLFRDALRVLDLCERPHLSPYVRLRSINISDPENLDLRLMNGEQVRIARAHIEPRMVELVGILRDHRQQNRVAGLINMTGEAGIPPAVQY